jgi:nitrogen fixation/metabolism regulation signal transduction histidine kinase
VYRLIKRLRNGKFGSVLLVKLAAIFAFVGLAPGMLIYVVSYQFVERSIESWFDVKVEGALQAGLLLATTSLETQSRDLGNQLRAAARGLADTPDTQAAQAIARARLLMGASDASLWYMDGRLIANSGLSRFDLVPKHPPVSLLRSLHEQDVVTQIEGLDDSNEDNTQPRIRALVWVPPGGSVIGLINGGPRVLEVVQPLPANLVHAALAVQMANREYRERALGRQGLRRMYIGTLTLTLFLAVFGAVLLAVALGKHLAAPLLLLADWMRQVAVGDLRPKVALTGRDELGGLTRSFAAMTGQLAEARAALETRTGEVEAARASLQTILDNLTTGVILLDPRGVMLKANPGATRILRQSLSEHINLPLALLPGLEDFANEVQAQFVILEHQPDPEHEDHWQRSFELYANAGDMGSAVAVTGNSVVVHLLARGALLPSGQYLLVFDDISEIVSAQRSLAWGEVARRLAHEIKNPLTPIQLSAERLVYKLTNKLSSADQAVLTKSVQTIVDQVDAMKRLVNEFRDYARLPPAQLRPVDLNELVAEVLLLYPEDSPTDNSAVRQIRFEPDPGCPVVRGDPQQLRQVIHNLVQNALDASEGARLPSGAAKVLIQTQREDPAGDAILRIIDHGHGFAEAILKRAFEPYVTTKAKGTGLGLAVVKKIADDHRARVAISNRVLEGHIEGAQVLLSFCGLKQQPSARSGGTEDALGTSMAASVTH